MRSLVVSDLHSNAEALRAVLSRVQRKRFDQIVCLGDFVGYGAEPNQVLDMMRTVRGTKFYIRGNHDRVAAGLEEGVGFNPAAKFAVMWTRDHLSAPNRHFLKELPLGPLRRDGMMICHGSPYDEDEYVFTEHHAAQVMALFETPVILYGHTHLPVIFAMDNQRHVWGASIHEDAKFHLKPGLRYLINPGSVGQPRDRNPRASFVLYDDEKKTVQFFRVRYDVRKTQKAILKAGLPPILAHRLAVGA